MVRVHLANAAARAGGGALAAVTVTNTAIAAYLGVLTVAGARRPRPTTSAAPTSTRFVIMVPAHDEEAVIADTLASFRLLDYDPTMFAVHVVADNCTDRTAEIVRTAGWTVHERSAPDDPGKGPALNWLFERLDATSEFDVALIVDADSVVDPGFLRAMDRAFTAGAVAAQGFYSVRDPGSSPSAGIRFAALACRHHLRPLGRCRLGASAGLYGNGMAFRRDVLLHRRWTGHLVEDAEFQMELLIEDGVVVTYVPDARLGAEMPETLDAATSQNARWERGRIDLAKRYVPALARRLPGAAGRRVAMTDAIVDHLVPPLSVVVTLQAVGLGANTVLSLLGGRGARRRLLVDSLSFAVIAAHVAVGLRAVDAPRSVYRSLTALPKMILWKLSLYLKALRPGGEVAWQRTQRNAER